MRRSLALAALLAAAALPGGASAHVGPHEVRVRNNVFVPDILEVDPEETVTWIPEAANHTITARDGQFRFPEGGGTVSPGTNHEWTTPDDDVWVLYHCEIHAGMEGALKVGNPPPLPPEILPVEVRQVPSDPYPTLRHAVVNLPPRARIELAPGEYALDPERPITVTVRRDDDPSKTPVPPEVTIAGIGEAPADVVLDGGGAVGTGIAGAVDNFRIRNLTMTGFTFAAVFLDGLEEFHIEDVAIEQPGLYGVRAVGGRHGRIARTTISGAGLAGISFAECPSCDAHVEDVVVEDGFSGVTATDAGPIVVRDSTFRGNGVGIVLRSSVAAATAPQRGAHIFGNLIEDNIAEGHQGDLQSMDLPLGAGIWIAGGWDDVVEDNTIRGHRWNVLLTGWNLPVVGARVVDNTVADATEADLAWDGLGAQTCFAGNAAPDGAAPSADPAVLTVLYTCGDGLPAGIPYPLLDAIILAGSL